MMTKTAFVRARVDPNLKSAAENILEELGISPTQAVTMLYKRIARDYEWPIELKILNQETKKAIKETNKGVGLKKFKNIDALFNDLGI